jgi:hypothetical protein
MQFRFLFLGWNVVPVDYQEFSWKHQRLSKFLADHAPVIVFKEVMLVCPK